MIPQNEWGVSVDVWNYMRPGVCPVEIEHVEDCLLAFLDWQLCIAEGRPCTDLLERHHEFARRIPDQLLLILCEEDATWEEDSA